MRLPALRLPSRTALQARLVGHRRWRQSRSTVQTIARCHSVLCNDRCREWFSGFQVILLAAIAILFRYSRTHGIHVGEATVPGPPSKHIRCEQCWTYFSNNRGLKEHIARFHAGGSDPYLGEPLLHEELVNLDIFRDDSSNEASAGAQKRLISQKLGKSRTKTQASTATWTITPSAKLLRAILISCERRKFPMSMLAFLEAMATN